MTDDPITPTEEENAAIARLSFTEDGRLLHRYLRRILETVVDMTEASTLLVQNGRRSLARDLMRQMAEGIETRRDGSSATEPILTRPGGARSTIAGARGARGFRRQLAAEFAAQPDTGTDTSGGSGTS